jgi:hypothetical protein
MKSKSSKPTTRAKFPSPHPALIEQLDDELGLSRTADTLEELDRLKANLVKADALDDPLQAALFTLAYTREAFSKLGLTITRLHTVERALSDVLQGRSNLLFEPRRKSKRHKKPPHTTPHKAVKVYAAVLLQAHFAANGGDLTKAAEAVAKALYRAGFAVTKKGGRATPETVIGWREELTASKPRDEWAAGLYRDLLKSLQPHGVRSIITGHPLALARRHAIKAAEQGLKNAVSELGK